MQDAPTGSAPRRPPWKRPGVVLAGVLLVLVTTVAVLAQPSAPEPALQVEPRNTALFALLADQGVVDALVDVTDERALVRYEVPRGADPTEVAYIVLGTAYAAVPEVGQVVLQVFADGAPREQIVVDMPDLALFAEGRIDREAFEERWTRTPA